MSCSGNKILYIFRTEDIIFFIMTHYSSFFCNFASKCELKKQKHGKRIERAHKKSGKL